MKTRAHRNKLDPRLRRAARKRTAGARKAAVDYEEVFVEMANARVAKWFTQRRWVRQPVHVVGGYYTARVATGHLRQLVAHKGVIELEKVRYLRPHLIQSVGGIRGHHATPRGMPDGKGVLIGLVDYGLDFTQEDFQNPLHGRVKDHHNPDGITRIAYLWDQQLTRQGTERAPSKYGYGVEYSSRQIDRALRSGQHDQIRHDPLGGRDYAGHGTHVAGIAAGNGETSDKKYRAGKYVGVAPAATIVCVSLNRQQIVRQVNSPGGTLANSANIAHAIAYCFETAQRLDMPCVVNLSLGCNGGGHDGNMVLERIIDALLKEPGHAVKKRGRAVVIAAGNEDRNSVHATGILKQGEQAEIEWEVGDAADRINDPNQNELEVWYPSGNAIQVWLVAPGHTETKGGVKPGGSGSFRFAKGERVSIYSDQSTPWNGAARIHIQLRGAGKKGIRFGTWIIRLRAIRVVPREYRDGVRFDAWIERTLTAKKQEEAESRFRRYDRNTAITVTTPGTARRAITVASYVNNGSRQAPISGFSGRGPTRDGRRKPELAAPGDWIFSTNAGAGKQGPDGEVISARMKKQGTSQAAPHVTGVVARMLSRNPDLTVEQIRDILIESATPPARGAQWDAKAGYGRLNAARAVGLVEQLVGKPPVGKKRAAKRKRERK